jgi:hypothetical protein
MELTDLPLPPEIWAPTPLAAQALIVALQERVHELEAGLGRNSSNSSRPPSMDPLQAPPQPKAPPTGRKRGGQPGHRGAYRALLSVEQVDEVVLVVPEVCRHCGQSLPEIAARRRGRVWRHQAAALCSGLSKWWPALWTCARVEGVEPTNNVAERALRPAVLWRKGRFGSDSEAGSQFAERLLTVVACCRQQGRRLLEFLVAAGEAVLHDTAAPSLLPAPLGG